MSWQKMGGKECFLERSGETMPGDHLVSGFYFMSHLFLKITNLLLQLILKNI